MRLITSFSYFHVGQGSAQLAVYAENQVQPFGVLYDCGSSAQTGHPKVLATRTLTQYGLFLRRNKPVAPSSHSMDAIEDKASFTAVLPQQLPPQHDDSLNSSDDSASYDSERKELINMTKDIRDTIAHYHLSYLFIFLSSARK
ncbi:hypothetical protein IM40_00385 [Candidatus Paracaedimonas acanthamoebae]|nr:hypothetical protein IM40_00385 [Candidatus Paracaedimonas acanthamoebae]